MLPATRRFKDELNCQWPLHQSVVVVFFFVEYAVEINLQMRHGVRDEREGLSDRCISEMEWEMWERERERGAFRWDSDVQTKRTRCASWVLLLNERIIIWCGVRTVSTWCVLEWMAGMKKTLKYYISVRFSSFRSFSPRTLNFFKIWNRTEPTYHLNRPKLQKFNRFRWLVQFFG